MLIGVLVAFGLSVVLAVVAYAFTSIPDPNSIATNQSTAVYYSDGHTLLGRIGTSTRSDVNLDQVPIDVQHAVLAAEDRNFYHEAGISPTGIIRALVTDIKGGEISQGGSTITQQYVKNAYLTQARTFTRKFKEILISLKLGNTRSKSTILQNYLNTIYFGRGADGIQAASQAYFHRSVSRLNVAQGAVLAAVIRAPSLYDPDSNHDAAVARWHYVINGMVKEHWLTPDKAAQLTFPDVERPRQGTINGCSGPLSFVCAAVKKDLKDHGFSEDRVNVGGYRIFTTIDLQAEKAAMSAEADHNGAYVSSGPDAGRESALISVQPGDGAIRAMYGGANCVTNHPDGCTDLTGFTNDYHRPPGSSFKPYTVIAALQNGISLDSRFHGPPTVTVNGAPISNSQDEKGCGSCSLVQALAQSINTVFVPLAQRVGPDNVVAAAHDAGIPDKFKLSAVPDITLGPDDVSPLAQATGYATIAAQGIEAEPYLVSKVKTASGATVYKARKKTHRAFPADVMADTTFAMTKVLDCSYGGTACGRSLSGRPAAGKTGTNGMHAGNKDAWFIGFTPQLSTAVWFGNHDKQKFVTSNGAALYGAGLPAQTWQEMMNGALQGKPVENFPPPAHVGQAKNAGPSSSSPTPSGGTSSSTPFPSQTPTGTPTQTLPPVTPPPSSQPPPSSSPTPTPSNSQSAPA